MLAAFPREVVGYWHDFGHSQAKEFLGWHDQDSCHTRRDAEGLSPFPGRRIRSPPPGDQAPMSGGDQPIVALFDMDGTLADHTGELHRRLELMRSPLEPGTALEDFDLGSQPEHIQARARAIMRQEVLHHFINGEQQFEVRQITGDAYPSATNGLNTPTTSGALVTSVACHSLITW